MGVPGNANMAHSKGAPGQARPGPFCLKYRGTEGAPQAALCLKVPQAGRLAPDAALSARKGVEVCPDRAAAQAVPRGVRGCARPRLRAVLRSGTDGAARSNRAGERGGLLCPSPDWWKNPASVRCAVAVDFCLFLLLCAACGRFQLCIFGRKCGSRSSVRGDYPSGHVGEACDLGLLFHVISRSSVLTTLANDLKF